MEIHQRLLCLFLFLFTLFSISQAHKFYVGGSQGWVPNPSESYNQWAGRNRFQINDSIVFKYKKGSDSVLEVKKEDYEKCNTKNPIKKFEEGDTEFKFDRSGPFYFISGKDGNCEKGQKLLVVVISPRTKTTPPSTPSPPKHSPSPATSPVPAGGSPAHSPGPKSPSPSPASSSSPSHGGKSPSTSPASSPANSPGAKSPSSSPASSPANSPGAKSPSTSPASSPGTTTSPSPASSPPAPSPATPPAAGGSSPTLAPSGTGTSGSPSSGTPTSSNVTGPAPGKSGGSSVAPSGFLVYSVMIFVGAVMLR